MLAIQINNLKKIYKANGKSPKKEALKGLSFDIQKGEFVGILGSNGAGKTTTINCITGITEPSDGYIKVLGHDVRADYKMARSKIGLSPQEFNIDIFQTLEEILYFQAGFFGITGQDRKSRIENLIKVFELESHRKKRFQFLSGGLKRRVIVAKSLIHDPDILILDEPTAGVDVETREALWKYIKEIHKKDKTIILTSHYLEEVEEMCNRVIIIKDGVVVKDVNMNDIKSKGNLKDFYLNTIDSNTQK